MGVGKFIYGDQVKFDITDTTATPETVLSGYTFHGANGEALVGNAEGGQYDYNLMFINPLYDNINNLAYAFANGMGISSSLNGNIEIMDGVTNCDHMFYNCDSLRNINVKISTKSVTSIAYMFAEDRYWKPYSLTIAGTIFNPSNIKNYSYAFYNCQYLNISLISINVPNNSDCSYMFAGQNNNRQFSQLSLTIGNMCNCYHMIDNFNNVSHLIKIYTNRTPSLAFNNYYNNVICNTRLGGSLYIYDTLVGGMFNNVIPNVCTIYINAYNYRFCNSSYLMTFGQANRCNIKFEKPSYSSSYRLNLFNFLKINSVYASWINIYIPKDRIINACKLISLNTSDRFNRNTSNNVYGLQLYVSKSEINYYLGNSSTNSIIGTAITWSNESTNASTGFNTYISSQKNIRIIEHYA